MENQKQKKVPLILFSGGLDSSFLLQQELTKGDVEVLYVDASQCKNKVEAEKNVHWKIINILEKLTGNAVLRRHTVKIESGCNTPDSSFQQPLMWLNGAFEVSDSQRHSELLVGYVAGDQICGYLGYIEQAWNAMQGFGKIASIPLRFPLMLVPKQDILDNIDPNVVQNIWVCELPSFRGAHATATQYKPCKQCTPCMTMAGQLHIWKLRHGEDYGKNIIRRLNGKKRDAETKEKSPSLILTNDT